MNEEDIFELTKGAYLCLVHPDRRDEAFRQEIMPLIALAPSAPQELVVAMITGASWRERLAGVCLAISQAPRAIFAEPMTRSLQNPRGLAIVPTCATLAVLAQLGVYRMPPKFGGLFDRAAFDGELGWAADKAMHAAGLRAADVPGCGPNQGQVFEDHLEVYRWLASNNPS